MQPGGFGGNGPGQPPYGGGYPPGGAPGYPNAPQPGYPQQPGQQQAPYPGAPPQQAAPAGYPGAPAAYPGAPAGYPGAPAGYPGAPQAGYPGAPAGYPGAPGGYPGAPQAMAAMGARNSFGQAQGALAHAGGMMKFMKYAFIGVGALCVLGGIALMITVDLFSGIGTIFTGVVFAVVAFTVLPRFTGMVSQASAMVDGFAAKDLLAQTGIPAQGRLLSVQQTGRLVNYNPEIQATVEVHHPQLGVYQTQTTAVVPQIAIPRAQPGAPVQVRVSPQNQHEIALVF